MGGPDVFVDKGNVDEAFPQADVVVEGDSTFHNAHQGAMDNWCCLVEWKEDQLTVWSNSYGADQTRMHISEMLGLPLHKVRAITSYVGGQFGKGDTGDQPFFLVTSLLAMKTGRPVKYRHNRHQSFINTRQPAIYHFKAGAKKDGTITSIHLKSIGNVGAYADLSMFALKFVPKELAEVVLAHIPNLRLESYGVYTNVIPGCMMRGVGNSQFNLIFAHMIDAVAEKLGMDPIDLCIKNFAHEWEQLPSKSLEAVLHEGARRIGWKEKRHRPRQGAGHRRRQEARRRVLLPSGLARGVAGEAPRQGPGQHDPQPGLHRAAQRGHHRDRRRLQHLQRPGLRRGPELPGHRARGHPLDQLRRHERRREGLRADRQRRLLPPVGGDGPSPRRSSRRSSGRLPPTILKLQPAEIDFVDGKVLVASQPSLTHDGQGDAAQGRQRAHHGGVRAGLPT